jgi:hypothetical protein
MLPESHVDQAQYCSRLIPVERGAEPEFEKSLQGCHVRVSTAV